MSEAALRCMNRGSSGGCRASCRESGVRAWRILSAEGVPGSQPRGVGAPREDGSSALQGLARDFAGRVGSVTGNVSGVSVPRTTRPKTPVARERAQPRFASLRGGLLASQLVTASPKRGTTWGRSRRQRLCGASGESASTGACKRARHRGGGEPAVRSRVSASPENRDTGGCS